MNTLLLKLSYVQIDETPIRYLDPRGDGKCSKSGFFWTASRPGGDAIYTWQTSRAATSLDNVVPADFSGVIQCDGYAVYASFAKGKATPPSPVPCSTASSTMLKPSSSKAPVTA